MTFVPLFCHSHHSPRGVSSPADLGGGREAWATIPSACAMMPRLPVFMILPNVCPAQGIRPVFGCRLIMEGLTLPDRLFPVDFLIETEQGYRNLVRMLTRYHGRGEKEKHPLKREDIMDRTQGLATVIPPDGELAELIGLKDRTKTEQFFKLAVSLCGANLALGVCQGAAQEAAGIDVICKLARFVGLRPVTASHVYYPEPGDAAAAVYLDRPGETPGRVYVPPTDLKILPCLWPEDEILTRWQGDHEELPHEAGNIARRCTWRPGRIKRAFPSMDLERGYDANSYLFDLVIRGATQRYGEITESLKKRINQEMEDVRQRGLAPYLLLNYQVIQALDDRGISRGVGRGRVISSVLAYCLGISRIDPLLYQLVPRSLVGEAEQSAPISIEIPGGAALALLGWMRETFGEDHVAEIGRIQEMRRDQMINDLATWSGMTVEERRLTHREKARLRSSGAAQRLDELAEGARSRRWRDPAFLGDVAARLAPRPRHWMGMGDRFVISGEPLDCIIPLTASHQGKSVTGVEEDAADVLGLARLIFAPHQLLDILDQAMRAARAQNMALDFRSIPLDDRATYDLLARGDTLGIPPLEGVTLRCLLRAHAPSNLLQLLRVKNEAERIDGEQSPREISDQLPDVLLSYQCAYLKANYPMAFFSAAIGSVIEQRGHPSALIRAARRAGFDVNPPDINLSDWQTSVHAGGVRLGLSAVRNFGQRAWENIHSVRSGGHFNSLENFCERIDTHMLNLRILKNLIASGAMDSFEQNRAAMDAMVSMLQRRIKDRACRRRPQ